MVHIFLYIILIQLCYGTFILSSGSNFELKSLFQGWLLKYNTYHLMNVVTDMPTFHSAK